MENEEGVCILAGRDDCKGSMSYGPDPYEQDVNGDETPVWLCQRHADDQAMEI